MTSSSYLLLLYSFSSPSWFVLLPLAVVFDNFPVVFSIPIFRCTVRFLLRSQLSFPSSFPAIHCFFSCLCSFTGPQCLGPSLSSIFLIVRVLEFLVCGSQLPLSCLGSPLLSLFCVCCFFPIVLL
jgi:hypothetical protein